MDVSALLIVIPTVVAPSSNSRPLLGVGSHKVDVWVGVDLGQLHGAELRPVQPQSLVRGERAAHLAAAAVPSIHSFLGTRRVAGTLTGVRAVANERQKVRDERSPSLFSGPSDAAHLSVLSSLDNPETGADLVGVWHALPVI